MCVVHNAKLGAGSAEGIDTAGELSFAVAAALVAAGRATTRVAPYEFASDIKLLAACAVLLGREILDHLIHVQDAIVGQAVATLLQLALFAFGIA